MEKRAKVIACCECKQLSEVVCDPATLMRLVFKSLCQECDFWINLILLADTDQSVRVDGHQYFIAEPEVQRPELRTKTSGTWDHEIRFHDGRVEKTSNLFFCGKIPARYACILSDNAVFVYPQARAL